MSESTRQPDSAARGVLLLTIAQAGTAVMSFAVHFVATRMLPKAEYGQLAVLLSVMNWASTAVGLILGQGLAWVLAEDPARLGEVFRAVRTRYVPIVVAVTGVLLAACPLLARAFQDPGMLVGLLAVMGQLPLLTVLLVSRHFLASLRRYGPSAGAHIVYSCLRAAGACGLIWLGVGALGVLYASAAAALVGGVLGVRWLRAIRRQITCVPYPPALRRAWHWTAMALPTTGAAVAMASMDLWLLKALLSDANRVGVYGAAVALAGLPRLLVHSLGGAVFPRLAHALSVGDRPLARSVAREAMRVLLVLFGAVFAALASSNSRVMALLFSDEYAAGGPALTLLIVSCLGFGLYNLVLIILSTLHRLATRMVLSLALLPVAVGLNMALIPRWGLLGAAWSAVGTVWLGVVVGMALVYRDLRVVPSPLSVLRCVVAASATYSLGYVWDVSGWFLLGKMAALGVVYLGLLVGLGELGPSDVRNVRQALRRSDHVEPGNASDS